MLFSVSVQYSLPYSTKADSCCSNETELSRNGVLRLISFEITFFQPHCGCVVEKSL